MGRSPRYFSFSLVAYNSEDPKKKKETVLLHLSSFYFLGVKQTGTKISGEKLSMNFSKPCELGFFKRCLEQTEISVVFVFLTPSQTKEYGSLSFSL